jgi:hypothetical protein
MVILIICLFLALVTPAHGIVDPLAVPNNRIGIHITDDSDLTAANALVNSQNGTWGYVTLVIREDDRNREKWQHTFDELREKQLIPLVRLATKMSSTSWTAPTKEQAKEWAQFLNSLNWVVKNRYIILFNEPNHAKEWGGTIAPHQYVEVADAFITELKLVSEDFFILPAGFDLMAPNSMSTMEVSRYYNLMHAFNPTIFTRFDGWTSHAYPNPHFSASPDATGKTSIRGHRWELNFLKQYGVKKDLPLFITETGWNADNLKSSRNLTVASKLEAYWLTAFNQAFIDSNIVAVTPFILRYLNPPFTGFSWIDPVTNEPLPHYTAVQNLPKTSGQPIQNETARITTHTLPQELISDSNYVFEITLKNTGQSIWKNPEYALKIDYPVGFKPDLIDPVRKTKPFQTSTIAYAFSTPVNPGTYSISFSLTKNGEVFGESVTKEITIIPPPNLLVKIKLWYKRVASGNDFSLLIYDEGDLVREIKSVTVENGQANIENIKSLIPEIEYRFVLTKPYYLPRQTFATIGSGQTTISFERLLPYDFYPDGQFTLRDVWNGLRHPINTFRLLSL